MAQVLREKRFAGGGVLRIVQGNIVAEPVDAIVNAANERLQHGGGVAGAISSAGGPEIQKESAVVAPVRTGSCAVTGAGRLPCRWVIHAVGPVYGGRPEDDDLLRSAARSALRKAAELGAASVSMPAISSGIFGFPKGRCAEILIGEAVEFLSTSPGPTVSEVRLCNFDALTAGIFADTFDARFAG